MDELELRCEKCTAFLRVRPKGTMVAIVVCSNSKCKHENNIKIITTDSSDSDLRFKFKEQKHDAN